jgi:lactoylglutathione lyase
MPATVLGVDHTGITVSSLDRSVGLWRDVLGFDLTCTFELTGDFAAALTGRAGAHTRHAVLAHGQRLVELVEYVSPADTETFRPRPCDVGSVHVAVGESLAIPDGARRGSLFAYMHDPDGVTLELIQLVPSQPGRPGEQS